MTLSSVAWRESPLSARAGTRGYFPDEIIQTLVAPKFFISDALSCRACDCLGSAHRAIIAYTPRPEARLAQSQSASAKQDSSGLEQAGAGVCSDLLLKAYWRYC
jgi:hypothetical protein